jgi:hypothetical protein
MSETQGSRSGENELAVMIRLTSFHMTLCIPGFGTIYGGLRHGFTMAEYWHYYIRTGRQREWFSGQVSARY